MSAPVVRYIQPAPVTRLQSVLALGELCKARLSSLVLATTGAGYLLALPAGESILTAHFLWTLLGTLLAAFGANGLNQCLEYPKDLRMARTCGRPIPSGRVGVVTAFLFSCALLAGGVGLLVVLVAPLAGALALLVGLLYVAVYTPLKQKTSLATLVGAVCGAIPPMIGWVGASGGVLAAGAWALFAILFVWQIPHFMAIDWFHRDDYDRGGFQMVSKDDPTGRFGGFLMLIYSLALIPVTLLAPTMGLGGMLYLMGAIVFGMAFFGVSVAAFVLRTRASARRLFLASLVYLPLVLGLLVIDPTV